MEGEALKVKRVEVLATGKVTEWEILVAELCCLSHILYWSTYPVHAYMYLHVNSLPLN